MVEIQSLSSINQSYINNVNSNDANIFASRTNNSREEYLNSLLESKMEEQGIFSKGWNDFKEVLNLGTSEEKCEEFIEKYKNGELSFEEAVNKIEEFDNKQESSLNLFSNIASSVLAITVIGALTAFTTITGGLGAAVAIGAVTGAVAKSGMKTLDRATNKVKGDAGDVKTIAKDALSGAITGGIATATMGTAGSASCVKDAVKGCAMTGLKTGTVSGAANYTIDCAFDEEKDFKFGEMIKTTASNAIVGAAVGGIMGGANGTMRSNDILHSGCNLETMLKGNNNVVKDVAANSVCTSEYKVLNDRIKATVA